MSRQEREALKGSPKLWHYTRVDSMYLSRNRLQMTDPTQFIKHFTSHRAFMPARYQLVVGYLYYYPLEKNGRRLS